MSDRDRNAAETRGCGRNAAAYLLGALEPQETQAFKRHLEGCALCRDEVAELAPVLDVLSSAAPPRPVRRGLRRRVLRAARDEPKSAALRGQGRRRPVTLSTPAGWLALGLAVAAAALLQLGAPRARTRVIPATVGRAELRVTDGRGDLIVERLAPLPADRVYELWLGSGHEAPAPSTLFAVTSSGRADIGVPGNLRGVSRLMVTVEPRGGTLVPTTRPVIQLPLTYVSPS